MKTQEVILGSGAVVRCRPVPPYIFGAMADSLPLPPVYPKIQLKSEATGSSEEAHALPDSPEYIAYRKKQREWQQLRSRVFTDFTLDYGVVDWRLEEGMWYSTPPEGWQPDPVLARWNVSLGDNPRVQYLKQEVILTDADADLINAACSETAPLKEEEVQKALVPFDSNEKEDQSTGLKVVAVESSTPPSVKST